MFWNSLCTYHKPGLFLLNVLFWWSFHKALSLHYIRRNSINNLIILLINNTLFSSKDSRYLWAFLYYTATFRKRYFTKIARFILLTFIHTYCLLGILVKKLTCIGYIKNYISNFILNITDWFSLESLHRHNF